MATDLEKLVVQMSADMKSYERELQRMNGVTNRQARAIENRFFQMNRRLDGIGRNVAKGLIAPLSGIGAALSVREVLAYADAWTSAKNSLAVAGVTGRAQAETLDRLFESAQRNATPIGALSDLYGKAAQASDNLAASQDDLLQFSDGVAVALRVAGTSASAASGALTQLGQILGSARVQADEFNSVNEGARPILIAVANGLDAAGGSVNKLKQLVNDGEVSGQAFFRAFLRGLPAIQSMAANATQTIDQGMTKVNNAFTRYIGETDASLGASQRLVQGLNLLADNFNNTADVALKLAGVIAAALVGRSIGGMIASLGLAVTAVGKLTLALRTAATAGGVAAAIGGFTSVAGPIGLVLASLTAALYLFADGQSAGEEQTSKVNAVLRELGLIAPDAASGIDALGASMDQQAKKADDLRTKLELLRRERMRQEAPSDPSVYVATSGEDIEDYLTWLGDVSRYMDAIAERAPKEVVDTFIALGRQAQVAGSDTEAILKQMNAISDFKGLDAPTLKLVEALKDAVAQLALVREGERQLAAQVGAMDYAAQNPGEADRETRRGYARSPLAEFARNAPRPPDMPDDIAYARNTGKALKGTGGRTKVDRNADDYKQMTAAIADRTAAIEAETAAQAGLNPLINDYGFAVEKARAEYDLLSSAQRAGLTITPELREQIDQLATAYASASVSAAQLAEQQGKTQQAAENFSYASRDVLGGFVSDLKAGVDGAVALANALDNVADKLLDMALNALFDPTGGGFLAKLFDGMAQGGPVSGGIGRAATGGRIRGPGTGTSDSIPMMLSDGEYVVRAAQAKKFAPLLEAINSGRIGKMAAGGLVGGAPRIPTLAGMGRGGDRLSLSMPISIDARGATPDAVELLTKRFDRFEKTLPRQVIQTIQQARLRNTKI